MQDFIDTLRKKNVQLIQKGEDLVLRPLKGALSPEQLKAIKADTATLLFIKEHKSEILRYLNTNAQTKNLPRQKSKKIAAYELSPLQEGMLFHQLYEEDSSVYMEQLVCDFPDGIDMKALKNSWEHLMEQHTILRTAFFYEELEIPVQCVFDKVELPFVVLDYSRFSEKERAFAIQKFLKEDIEKGFVFDRAPLMRIALLHVGGTACKMIWTHHHILLDGWSLSLLMGGFLEVYESFVQGRSAPEKPIDHYQKYIEYIRTKNDKEATKFWRDYLGNFTTPSLLEANPIQKPTANTEGSVVELPLKFGPEITAQIKAFANKNHLTVNTLVQGVWGFLLSTYTGDTTVGYGVVVSGRPTDFQAVEGRVGLYINTIPLCVTVLPGAALIPWFQNIQKRHTEAREYEYTSLAQIGSSIGFKGAFFNTLLVFENYPVAEAISTWEGSLSVRNLEVSTKTNYPLMLTVNLKDTLTVRFDYDPGIFDRPLVERLSKHFLHTCKQLLEGDVNRNLESLDTVLPAERKLLLNAFNNTKSPYNANTTVLDTFHETVSKKPEQPALSYNGVTLSYYELDKKANQLAHFLIRNDIPVESTIGIGLKHSPEMVIALLGVLKAGCIYVPIDPEYPQARIEQIVFDAALKLVIVKEPMSAVSIDHLLWEDFTKTLDTLPFLRPDSALRSSEIAYIIYTSGSTGKPKGVTITHQSLYNYMEYGSSMYGKGMSALNFPLFTSFAFDLTQTSIFLTLGSGGCLFIRSTDVISFLGELPKEINCIKLTPSHALFLEEQKLSGIKVVITGGEALDQNHIAALRASFPNGCIYNEYGPTEATIGCSVSKLNDDSKMPVPIGNPIANTQLYVLSENKELCPIGVPGELYIGGDGLARGYWNDKKRTQEKFSGHRLFEDTEIRLYQSGDRALWDTNGNLYFIGRIDQQVKIGGYRIEPEEIQIVLETMPQVKKAFVRVRNEDGTTARLIAYIIPNGKFEKEPLVASLKKQLPIYMIPNLWVAVSSFPLTVHGKIDIASLPGPDGSQSGHTLFKAPSTDIEKRLAHIWAGLLKLERVGVLDDFFELGGHSLLATRLVTAIRREFGIRMFIKDLFNNPTIEGLVPFIETGALEIAVPPILKKDRPEKIPLSFTQERLWFLDKLQGTSNYHIPMIIHMKGELLEAALEAAFQEIINRHESIRTGFFEGNGIPFQEIFSRDAWRLKCTRAQHLSRESLRILIDQEIQTPFNLEKDHKLRANLWVTAEQEYTLVVVMHHIASDGWSMPILIRELIILYEAKVKGTTASLPVLPIQYADYALWQRSYQTGNVLEKQLTFWEQKLAGVQDLNLRTDFKRPPIQGTKGRTLHFDFPQALLKDVKKVSRKTQSTLFMTLLAAFKVLLYRYSNQDDICVGIPIANRRQHEVESLVGFFVNTIALRSDLGGNPSFTSFLLDLKQTVLESFEFQEVPFEKVVKRISGTRNMAKSPIFQVVFSFQNNQAETVDSAFDNLQLTFEQYEHTSSQYDISFDVKELHDRLKVAIEYNTDLFKETTIQRMGVHFEKLLLSISKTPDKTINDLDLLPIQEEKLLLTSFNTAAIRENGTSTVLDFFKLHAEETPDAIALVMGNRQMTYRELQKKSNQAARLLLKRGVKESNRVGVFMERSMDIIIGILGILKVGASYVPIDPLTPEDRTKHILKTADIQVVVCDEVAVSDFENNKSISCAVVNESAIQHFPEGKLSKLRDPDLEAYVIFTSGSTGLPKGVSIQHGSLVNLMTSLSDRYEMHSDDRVLQFSSIAFDASVEQIWIALTNGARLVLVDKETLLDSELFNAYIRTNAISHLDVTPSFLEGMPLDTVGSVKRIVMGGEVCKATTIERYLDKVAVYNLYGTTETTIDSTVGRVTTDQLSASYIPIGKPVSNTPVYVLDKAGKLCPIGVPGELCIGGVGVSQGYVGNKKLTETKFVKDTFSDIADARYYKTGDLGCFLEDGNLLFLGRIDEQLKIRGYRIEPGEIETVLNTHTAVGQSAVRAWEDDRGRMQLVAYVVANDLTEDELEGFLEKSLPAYMVPRRWVFLASLPLTLNGKVDKKKLVKPAFNSRAQKAFVAPQGPLQSMVADVWSELLGIEKIGIEDNFFQLGGDSLISIQVISRLKKEGYHLKPRDLFEQQTIQSLAQLLPSKQVALTKAEQGLLVGDCPLAPIQKWYFEHNTGQLSHYNQAVLFGISKDLDPALLALALEPLVAQHDVLRCKYTRQDQKWIQEYGTHKGVLQFEDLRDVPVTDFSKTVTAICNTYQTSLSIAEGNVFKAVLMHTGAEEANNRIFFVAHHLIVDAVSWGILLNDFETLVRALVSGDVPILPAKSSSYREWIQHYSAYANRPETLASLAYWEKQQQKFIPTLSDFEGEVSTFGDVSREVVSLSKELTKSLLQQVHGAYGTNIKDILLSALASVLASHNQRNEVTIGLEGHGRNQFDDRIDISSTVGWFTSVYPLGLQIPEGDDLACLIKSVKEQIRLVPHKGLSYDALKYLHEEKEVRCRLEGTAWDVVFNYLGQADNAINASSWVTAPTESSGESMAASTVFDSKIEINGSISNGVLSMGWNYSKKEFKAATIQEMGAGFIKKLASLIRHCEVKKKRVFTPSDFALQNYFSISDFEGQIQQWESENNGERTIETVTTLSKTEEEFMICETTSLPDGALTFRKTFDGEYSISIIRQAWRLVQQDHSQLRTNFYSENLPVALKCVFENSEIPFSEVLIDKFSEERQEQKIEQLLVDMENEVGKLEKVLPWKVIFVKKRKKSDELLCTVHPILGQNIEVGNLLQEFELYYEAVKTNSKIPSKNHSLFGVDDSGKLGQSTEIHVKKAIPLSTKKDIDLYEVLPNQRREFLLYLMGIRSRQSKTLTFAHTFADLNHGALTKALESLVQRHESLRTIFHYDDSRVLQSIRPFDADTIILRTVELKDSSITLEQKQKYVEEMAFNEFKLDLELPYKCLIIKCDANISEFVFAYDHIVGDGAATGILKKELLHLYECYKNKKLNPFRAKRIHPKDFAFFFNQHLEGNLQENHRKYFETFLTNRSDNRLGVASTSYREQLTRQWDALDLPDSRFSVNDLMGEVINLDVRPGTSYRCLVDDVLFKKMKRFSQEQGITLYNVFFGAYAYLLAEKLEKDQVLIRSPYSLRNRPEFKDMVGWLLGNVVMKVEFPADIKALEVFAICQKSMLNAVEHTHYPIAKILNDFDVTVDNLIDGNLNIWGDSTQNMNLETVELGYGHIDDSLVDISFIPEIFSNGIVLNLEYRSTSFSREEASEFFEVMFRLISDMIDHPNLEIKLLQRTILKEIET